MTSTTADSPSRVTPLLLDAADAVLLRGLLDEAAKKGNDVLRLGHLKARIDSGGDEIIVQAGMEGGVIQGWTANCPVDCFAIEWDEQSHLVIESDGTPRLIGVNSGGLVVSRADAEEHQDLAATAVEIKDGEMAVAVKTTRGTYHLEAVASADEAITVVREWDVDGTLCFKDIAACDVYRRVGSTVEHIECIERSEIVSVAQVSLRNGATNQTTVATGPRM